ncbi:MAG: energy transducer TonB, partial [Pseudomonas sp.]
MYVLFRARQLLGSVPALIALVLIALGIQSQTLKVEPVYDESAVELALVEPEPEVIPEPVVEQAPPPPVIEDEEAEAALPPPPPPKPLPKPEPKPKPKPVPKPVVAKPAPAP